MLWTMALWSQTRLHCGAERTVMPRFEVLQLVGDGTLVKGRHGAAARPDFG